MGICSDFYDPGTIAVLLRPTAVSIKIPASFVSVISRNTNYPVIILQGWQQGLSEVWVSLKKIT